MKLLPYPEEGPSWAWGSAGTVQCSFLILPSTEASVDVTGLASAHTLQGNCLSSLAALQL